MRTNKQMFELIRQFITSGSRKLIYRESLDIMLKYLKGEIIDIPTQLTIEELRDQFEINFMGGVTLVGKTKCKDGFYTNTIVSDNWNAWLQCARDNKILKEI